MSKMIGAVTNIRRNDDGRFIGKVECERNRITVYGLPEDITENDLIEYDLKWNRQHTGQYGKFIKRNNVGIDDEELSLKDVISNHRSICWYPSAGDDFKPLIFLNQNGYRNFDIPEDNGQEFPDMFIMTDVLYPMFFSDERNPISQLNNSDSWRRITELYRDFKTTVSVVKSRKLRRLDLELDTEMLSYEYSNEENYGNVFCFTVKVETRLYWPYDLKQWYMTVVYVIAENRAFARDFLMKNNIKVDYVPVIRYGEAMGGGSAISPNWIRSILGAIKCKYYICNAHYAREEKNMVYFEDYDIPATELKEIKRISGNHWSEYGDVVWNRVCKINMN